MEDKLGEIGTALNKLANEDEKKLQKLGFKTFESILFIYDISFEDEYKRILFYNENTILSFKNHFNYAMKSKNTYLNSPIDEYKSYFNQLKQDLEFSKQPENLQDIKSFFVENRMPNEVNSTAFIFHKRENEYLIYGNHYDKRSKIAIKRNPNKPVFKGNLKGNYFKIVDIKEVEGQDMLVVEEVKI